MTPKEKMAEVLRLMEQAEALAQEAHVELAHPLFSTNYVAVHCGRARRAMQELYECAGSSGHMDTMEHA